MPSITKLNSFVFFYLLFIAYSLAYAIDPSYDGNNGILEQVLASNCLQCHSSKLSNNQRQGAPITIDFDTYETAIIYAPRIVSRASTLTMPPSNSTSPLLTTEQIAALFDWQNAGFPETQMTIATATPTPSITTKSTVNSTDELQEIATFSFNDGLLKLPSVNAEGIGQFNVILQLDNTQELVFSIKSLVELNNIINQTVASFSQSTLTIPRLSVTDNTQGVGNFRIILELTSSDPILFKVSDIQRSE